MDTHYHWRITPPEDRLHLSIGCRRDDQRIFHADLQLNRTPLTDGRLALSLIRRPIAAAHILAAIYYQALRLRMKKCQFYPHPSKLDDQKTGAAPTTAPRKAESKLLEQR